MDYIVPLKSKVSLKKNKKLLTILLFYIIIRKNYDEESSYGEQPRESGVVRSDLGTVSEDHFRVAFPKFSVRLAVCLA